MPKWMEWFNKIDNGLEKIERALAVILFTLLIGMICGNIFARNVLHISSYRFLELAPAVVLWLALVGATLALKHQRHIKIELLLRFLPRALQTLAVSLTSLFAMGVCAVLTYAGIAFVRNEIVLFGARGWLAGCLVLFFALACFRFALRLLQPWSRDQEERS
jgi:TRAP-type C4-dicarboxylate transport system permease small subunit